MRLLTLSAPVQKLLMAGEVEMGHARALIALPAAEQILCANEIVAKRLSVREAERRAARAMVTRRKGATPRAKQDKSRDLVRLEEMLSDHLTAPVEIRLRRRAGRAEQGEIALHFRSLDELNGLLDKLGVRDR
jgi:ParB family chromosome partitioning protein